MIDGLGDEDPEVLGLFVSDEHEDADELTEEDGDVLVVTDVDAVVD